jgi:hypothetical protein
MTEEVVSITVNGLKFGVGTVRPLSFGDVAELAGFKVPALPSMTLKQRGSEGRILHPGDSVLAVEGMVFNVADTSNA